jgi:hypothetical protein
MKYVLAAVLLSLGVVASAQAQTTFVTSKLWPYQDEQCPAGVEQCPVTFSGAPEFVGYPANPTFKKFKDDTQIRCTFAGVFLPEADTTITEGIIVDDGSLFGVFKGDFTKGGVTTSDVFTITFIKDKIGRPIPAGNHSIRIALGSNPAVPVQFSHQYGLLECFEETVGKSQ